MFSQFVFVLLIYTWNVKLKRENIFAFVFYHYLFFCSTVPPNTQSCWKPQKLPSQYSKSALYIWLYCFINVYSLKRCLCSRRKRGEKGEVVETIEDVIVRRLTTERIEELKKLLRDTQEQYKYVHAVLKASEIIRFFFSVRYIYYNAFLSLLIEN